MTRGEKIAWIWVWSAIALVTLTGSYAAWGYRGLPQAFLSSLQCNGSDVDAARSACESVLSHEHATVAMQAAAHLRLASMAKSDRKHDVAIDHYSSVISLGQATADDWNERGLSYYSLRQYEKAAEDFRQAAAMNGTEGVYWSNIGDAQIEMKKYGEAYDNYTAAIDNKNDTAEVRGNRGWASYQLGKYEKALADYDQAISQDGQHTDNLNERGLVRHAMKNYEEALSDYDRALAVKPDNPVILTNRGMTQARIGNFDKAEQDFDRAIALDLDYSTVHVEKAWLQIDLDRPEAALAEIATVEKNGPLDLFGLEARARARIDLADWQGAAADAEQALAMGSTSDWPYEFRARARRALGDYEGAAADAAILVTRDPKNINRLVTRAISLHLGGHTEAALAEMDQAIAQDIAPAYAYEIKSYVKLGSGKVKEAVSDARQSVALASTAQAQHSNAILGWALLEDQQPDLAIEACSKSLAIGTNSGAYSCRAIAYLALHRADAALAEAKLALGVDKLSSAGHFALGRVELAQGRAADAVKEFDSALKLEVFGRSEILMYRGDAEAALGHIDKARMDYQTARKLDPGLHRKALDERLAKLSSQ